MYVCMYTNPRKKERVIEMTVPELVKAFNELPKEGQQAFFRKVSWQSQGFLEAERDRGRQNPPQSRHVDRRTP